MKKIPNYQKGLTLIEIMVVIGIFMLIIGFGTIVDLNFVKRDLLKAEEDVIVSSLEKARSRSMNNIFESAHGFCYISPNYIIFRDSPSTRCVAGESTNEVISANVGIAENSGTTFPTFVIFSQLAGTTTDNSIVLSDGVRLKNITINHEGRIDW